MEPEVRHLPRYYAIDLLRFVAALGVVCYHYTFRGYAAGNYSPVAFEELGRVTRYGYLGVELFFIISGYVVLLSAQGKTVRQFVQSRITRLYPAFWAACTLTFVVERLWGPGPADGPMAPELHAGLAQYAYNLTMLHGFLGTQDIDGAYWSLAIEITFYFLVALLIAFRLLPHLDLCLALWLGYALLPGIARSGTPFANLFFPEFAPYFAAGMLFYLLQPPQGRRWWRYGLLAVAYGLALRGAGAQARQMMAGYHTYVSPAVAMSTVTLFFGVFYVITRHKISFSRSAWLAGLGALTYPLYLIHSNIGFIILHRIGPFTNKYVLLSALIMLMLGLAWLLHVLVEKPLRKPLGALVARWFGYLDHRPTQA